MANEVITGHQGNVAIGASDPFDALCDINVSDWTLTIESDIFDASAFNDETTIGVGASNTMTPHRGMYKVRGTIRGMATDALGVTAAWIAAGGATSTLTLTQATGKTYSGEALLDFTVRCHRTDGLVEFEAEFESDGNWSFA